ncbi:YadA family autotransporter adhesin [Silvimonas iriomotensis]
MGHATNVGDALSLLDQQTTIIESVAYDAKWRTDQLDQLAVKYDDATHAAVTLNPTGAPVRIKNVADGVESTDAVNLNQLNQVDGKVALVDNRVTVVEGDVSQLQNSITRINGSLGDVVLYDDPSHTSVTLNPGGHAVQVKNVEEGTDEEDAVNMRQLSALQSQVNNINQNIGNIGNVVFYDGDAHDRVTLSGANGTVIDNVAAGQIAAGSMEAVNGGQIQALQDQFDTRITQVQNVVNNHGGQGATGVGSGDSYQTVNEASPLMKADGDSLSETATVAAGSKAVALGAGASASADNSVALGAGSVADRAGTVSVGSAGNERIISNVAAGVQGTDAVNVEQLNQGVASANSYTDQQVGGVNQRVDGVYRSLNDLDDSTRRGIAAAAALMNIVPYVPGKTTMNAGTAIYRGRAAVAVGASRWNDRGTVNVNGGVSSAGNNNTIFRAGVGVVFD